ncbi:unnamed protein product [Mytilus edulis]|uniref:Uncharacterized protein n=1 Tax=Mytilus edulis TaxID=6550 RepID=A0A8S3TYH0_MYTED|nr:unnamed protein product [Mytilus edulis]
MDTSVDLTEEEVRNIIAAFKDMHMKPNAESPDAFKDWMKEFSTQKSLYTGYIPRIPTFSGDNKGDNTYEDYNHLLLAMRELEHQQKEYTKENTPPVEKKPTPAKRANVPRKKDKNELETVVKQLMSQIELLEKRQEQLINNSKHNRTDLIHQTPDETIAYRPLDMNKRKEKHQKTFSIDEDEEKEKPRPTPAPRLRPRKNRETDPQPTPSLHDSTLTSSDEESDDDYLVYVVTEPDVEDLSAPHSAIDELETQDDDDTVQDEDDDDQEHVAEQQDTGIEGDDLPSEESDTVDPVLEPDEVSETDQQVADTTLSDDTEEPGQDATVDETVENVPQPDIEAPWIEPRRSVRARTSTATTKYKDFIVSKKSQPQPDWKSRADYLKDIASSGTFKGMEDQILAGLLKIATEK